MSDVPSVEEEVEGAREATVAWRHAKRVVAAVVGATLLLLGTIMLVTPGPGSVVLFLGLSTLAAEFAWARRLLRRAKAAARLAVRKLRASRMAKEGRKASP